jgi:hypothetical protein
MTAVEQLIYQLTSIGVLEIPQGSNAVTSIIEQAKEMEKEQSNAKIQKAIEVFEEAKSKAITIKDMFYYLDIVLVALEGIKNETFKSE